MVPCSLFVLMLVSVYIMCVYTYMCIQTYECSYSWRTQDSFWHHLQEYYTPPSKQVLSLAWNSPTKLDQLIREPQGCCCLCLADTVVTHTRHHAA